jgi:hypothetical protein
MKFSTLTGTVALSAAGVFAREMAVDEERAASTFCHGIDLDSSPR